MMDVQIGGTCRKHPLNIVPCEKCAADWLAGKSEGPTQAPAYGMVDPDYARIYTQARIIAWQYGFACVMHGSFTRDLDLLLVPWEDRAHDKTAEQVIRIIADACNLNQNGGDEAMKLKYDEPLKFTAKPHGRRAVSLHLPGFRERRWVDISVLPCEAKGSAAGNAEYESWQTPAGVSVVDSKTFSPPDVDAKERGE